MSTPIDNPTDSPTDGLAEQVRGAAFRRLLRTNAPATAGQLAEDLNHPEPELRATITELTDQGWLQRDTDGDIIGAAGLSIRPDRHQIELDGTTFWTWCAYDILGIVAALGATGHASTPSPAGGPPLTVRFHDGQPEPSTLVLFLPQDEPGECCSNVYEQWCPNSNLFHTAEDATTWATEHGVTGTVLTLAQAAERGGARWQPLTQTSVDHNHSSNTD